MVTFGFSYIGVIYLLMLFIPNIIWAKNQPNGYNSENESRILRCLERVGEILCTCCVLIFSDFNIRMTEWVIWLGVSFVLMILYELYWIRYFKSNKTVQDFYKPFLGFSVPGATLPVMAFFLLGIYGTNIFLIVSSVILGIGHIGIHRNHYKKLECHKNKLSTRIIKGILFTIFVLIFAVISFFIGARNINYIKHYQLIKSGCDEGIYVELGGQEQYILVRGENKDNPVIIFLHGGPSSPESYVNYSFVNALLSNYTVVDWDQRGCGRTYVKNEKLDSENETASYEQALLDLDEIVDYVRNRFHQNQVIIIGHSYGTILATDYIVKHPEKVSSYVAIAQVVSMDICNQVLAQNAISSAKANERNYESIQKALEEYNKNPSVSSTMSLRQIAFEYLPEPLTEKSTWIALTSPYMGMPDFKWFLKQLKPMDEYFELNRQLFDSMLEFDLCDKRIPEEVAVTYISGSLDYACPVQTISDYISQSGVERNFYIIKDCGHNVQYTKSQEVSEIILKALGDM